MKKVKLGDIAVLKTGPFGTQFSAKEYVESGIPVINVKNIGYGDINDGELDFIDEATRQRLSEHILITGDIVFGRKGSVDRHAYIDERYDGWVQGSDCIRVRCLPEVNSKFVSHYLKLDHIKKTVNNSAVGSTMASLNTDILKDIILELPSIEEQFKIENTISLIEEKIRVNCEINDNLEHQMSLLYDYWFIQYKFPDKNGNPYDGPIIWNDKIKKSIPSDWGTGTISDYGTIISGGTPSTFHPEYYTSSGHAWITPNDLSGKESNMFISHGERDITDEGIKNSSATPIPEGSILISTRAPIGYLAISQNEVCTNQGFKSIIPQNNNDSFYIYYFIKRNIPALTQLGTGTTFKEISKDALSSYPVPLIPEYLMQMFHTNVESLCLLRKNNEIENQNLMVMRDWLLPMLMNGQATIED